MNQQEITEGTEMEGQQLRLPDSGNGRSISPLSPFPPVQSQTHESTLRVPNSVRSAMFILTPTPDAWPSSFRSGTNGILHPTALQWWAVLGIGRRHKAPEDGLFSANRQGWRAVHAQSGHRGTARRGDAKNVSAIPTEMPPPRFTAWVEGTHLPGWSCAQSWPPFTLSARSRSSDNKSAKSTRHSASRFSSRLSAGPASCL